MGAGRPFYLLSHFLMPVFSSCHTTMVTICSVPSSFLPRVFFSSSHNSISDTLSLFIFAAPLPPLSLSLSLNFGLPFFFFPLYLLSSCRSLPHTHTIVGKMSCFYAPTLFPSPILPPCAQDRCEAICRTRKRVSSHFTHSMLPTRI